MQFRTSAGAWIIGSSPISSGMVIALVPRFRVVKRTSKVVRARLESIVEAFLLRGIGLWLGFGGSFS